MFPAFAPNSRGESDRGSVPVICQWLCFRSTTGPVSISGTCGTMMSYGSCCSMLVGVPFVSATWLAASSRSMCSVVIGVVAGLATSWAATFGTSDVGT